MLNGNYGVHHPLTLAETLYVIVVQLIAWSLVLFCLGCISELIIATAENLRPGALQTVAIFLGLVEDPDWKEPGEEHLDHS